MKPTSMTRWWIVVIVLAGFAARVWRLGEVPFGLHWDEGHNAMDAWSILQGWRPVFLPGNNGREAMFFYLVAGLQGMLGPSIWSTRLAASLCGTVAIAMQYTLVRSLPLPNPRRIALFSAALVAVTFWPVAQGRYLLRAGLQPVWVALMLWAWWRALDLAPGGRAAAGWLRSRPWLPYGAVAGVAMGGAVNTYIAGRLLPAVLAVSAVMVAVRFRTWRPLAALVVALALAAVLSIPLLRYFQVHPDMWSYRADQISVLNPEVSGGDPVGFLVDNGVRLVGMFTHSGDSAWHHNLIRRPVFDPLLGLAFLGGLALLLRRLFDRRRPVEQAMGVLLAVTLAVLMTPSWLSVGAPNYVRLTGIWPVVFLLPAWGLDWLATRIDGAKRALGMAVATTVVLIGSGIALHDYFVVYANRPELYRFFNAGSVERGKHLADLSAAGPTYATPALLNQSVLVFLTADRPPTVIDPRAGLVLPPEGDAVYAFDPVEHADAEAFGARWPGFDLTVLPDRFGGPSLFVFRLPREAWPTPGTSADRRFGDALVLEAFQWDTPQVRPGEDVRLTLQWRADAPTRVDQNLFVHLVAADGRTVGQWDGPPLGGSYGTDRWQPGERVLLPLSVPVDSDAPAGPITARIGWYDYRTQARLPVAGDDDGAVEVGVGEVVR